MGKPMRSVNLAANRASFPGKHSFLGSDTNCVTTGFIDCQFCQLKTSMRRARLPLALSIKERRRSDQTETAIDSNGTTRKDLRQAVLRAVALRLIDYRVSPCDRAKVEVQLRQIFRFHKLQKIRVGLRLPSPRPAASSGQRRLWGARSRFALATPQNRKGRGPCYELCLKKRVSGLTGKLCLASSLP